MRFIETPRLRLEPLLASHAQAMFDVLADPAIYRYLDHPAPASVEQLLHTYSRLEGRESPDGEQLWLNWVIRTVGGPLVGYVQATVVSPHTAWVAYVLSGKHWDQGYATEAMQAMLETLALDYGVVRYLASVEAENKRSIRLLERLGFQPGTGVHLDGQALSPSERLFVR
jgi:ribosomal-protein-alanine N-acetyltransferase